MKYRKTILFLVLLADLQTVHSQFVEVKIDLPAYNEVKIVGSAQTVLKNEIGLQWIGISVAENIELGIRINYRELVAGESPVQVLFLNDNSSDFAKAVPVKGNPFVLLVYNGGRLIKEIKNEPASLIAWIGVPAVQVKEVIVEYN